MYRLQLLKQLMRPLLNGIKHGIVFAMAFLDRGRTMLSVGLVMHRIFALLVIVLGLPQKLSHLAKECGC